LADDPSVIVRYRTNRKTGLLRPDAPAALRCAVIEVEKANYPITWSRDWYNSRCHHGIADACDEAATEHCRDLGIG